MLPTTSRKIIKRLEKAGWVCVRIKGDHYQFKHEDFRFLITVPHPKKDFPKGTLNSIYKAAGWK